jgi:hypothetical protein
VTVVSRTDALASVMQSADPFKRRAHTNGLLVIPTLMLRLRPPFALSQSKGERLDAEHHSCRSETVILLRTCKNLVTAP